MENTATIRHFDYLDEDNSVTFENDNYIDDITKIEEEGDYDWYNFYPDAGF